ncbi:hypothetical protein KDU71_02605 [Carboxylicivirga sediminis]|uniref:Uncharacterized protein n=1 Tax=Carboxylicivirga sediminis TaxID=2006564 RepID=A0A941ITR1_9BACT|nr:hypothetical protein [Carboxylicivirga sediminis]MBR8534436.1 hypothetical protein [Carboxylicivirga sediminis]
MITSFILGDKTKTLLIGGAIIGGLILLSSASSGETNKPALNGTPKKKCAKKPTKKTATRKPSSPGRKTANIKI